MFSRNQLWQWKSKIITYSECVSVTFYPACNAHAPCYSRLWHVCLSLPHFSTLSRKWHYFRENVIEHKRRVLIFSTTFVRKISHYKRIQRDFTINVHTSPCEVPLLSDFSWNFKFLYRFSKKKTFTSYFIKIRPAGAELFRVDGQTDRHDGANSAFHNFANAPKNQSVNAE